MRDYGFYEVSRRKRPTRRDLLLVIGELQDLFGRLAAAAGDRNPNRAQDLSDATKEGLDLCILARSFDDPLEGTWP